METYEITQHGKRTRVRWVFDETYEAEGSFAYDTEEETQAAVEETLRNIASGKWVALGAIVEHRIADKWHDADSLWGIVIEPKTRALRKMASGLDLDRTEFIRGKLALAHEWIGTLEDELHSALALDDKAQRARAARIPESN